MMEWYKCKIQLLKNKHKCISFELYENNSINIQLISNAINSSLLLVAIYKSIIKPIHYIKITFYYNTYIRILKVANTLVLF